MKKRFLITILFLISFLNFGTVNAQINLDDDKLDIDYFYSKTCTHCAKEAEFLKELSLKNVDIDIEKHEISTTESIAILKEYYDLYEVPEEYRYGIVPVTFIEQYYVIGFGENTKQKFNEIVDNFFDGKNGNEEAVIVEQFSRVDDLKSVQIPLIGEVNFANFPPWLLSVAFGVLDGFNACAMAALAILLTVLIGLGDRKKMVLIGGIFLLVSGLVYYIFMAAWLNLFLVLPHLQFLTILTGVVVVIFAVMMLREYFTGVICKLCEIDPKKQSWFARQEKKLMLKMQSLITGNTPFLFMVLGVIVIAAGINLIELVCSFGLPVAFTKILTGYSLSFFEYHFYLFIYVLFYMIDDFIIFLLAVFTFNLTQESEKYIKIAKVLSGVLLLILGIIMIFFPEVLGLL